MGDAHRGATSLLLGLPRGWLASRAAGSTCPHVRLKPVQPSSSQRAGGPGLDWGTGGTSPPPGISLLPSQRMSSRAR